MDSAGGAEAPKAPPLNPPLLNINPVIGLIEQIMCKLTFLFRQRFFSGLCTNIDV